VGQFGQEVAIDAPEGRFAPEGRVPFVQPHRPPFPRSRPPKQVYPLPVPRPADWGVGVTTCLASLATDDCIVAVSDMMISMDWVSGDSLSVKSLNIGANWRVMFSGNDVTPVIPIMERVRSRAGKAPTVNELTLAFEQEYATQIRRRAEAEVLSTLGLSMQTFLTEGLKDLGPALFSQFVCDIRNVRSDLEFLVFGFDREPRMFIVSHPGIASDYGVPGFWAIGSGSISALGMLYNIGHNKHVSAQGALYNLCAAKFLSESASGVGKATFAVIARSNSHPTRMTTQDLEPIRKLWERKGRPRQPASAESVSEAVIKKADNVEEEVRRQRAAEAAGPGAVG